MEEAQEWKEKHGKDRESFAEKDLHEMSPGIIKAHRQWGSWERKLLSHEYEKGERISWWSSGWDSELFLPEGRGLIPGQGTRIPQAFQYSQNK